MKLLSRVALSFLTSSESNSSYRRTLSTLSLQVSTMSGGGRKIARVVSPTASGPINRLIGTVDVDGKGTDHPLAQVDPFMLLDQGTITENGKPPFGAHPHRGHSVVTVLTRGQVKSWDSYTHRDTVVKAPASYWVDAGSGVFHDETTVIPDPSDPQQHVSLFQLWISVKEEDRVKQASVQYDTNLPIVDAKNVNGDVVGTILYYVGDGVSIRTPHPITVAYVTQKPGTILNFPVDPTHGGFAVHVKGAAKYGGEDAAPTTKANVVHELAPSADGTETYLEVATPDGDSSANYLICVGEKIEEPWFKKLVANGAVIARTPEEAREIASRVEGYSEEGLSSGNFAPFGVAPLSDQKR